MKTILKRLAEQFAAKQEQMRQADILMKEEQAKIEEELDRLCDELNEGFVKHCEGLLWAHPEPVIERMRGKIVIQRSLAGEEELRAFQFGEEGIVQRQMNIPVTVQRVNDKTLSFTFFCYRTHGHYATIDEVIDRNHEGLFEIMLESKEAKRLEVLEEAQQ